MATAKAAAVVQFDLDEVQRAAGKRGRAFNQMPNVRRLDRLTWRSRPSVRARRAVIAPGAGSTAMTGAQFETPGFNLAAPAAQREAEEDWGR